MRSAPWRLGADFARIADPARLRRLPFVSCVLALALLPRDAGAMHLADGVLPGAWCIAWTLLALPFVAIALRRFERGAERQAGGAPFTAMAAAAVFALSCMPIPVPFVGSCSHLCGTGLAAVLLGPWLTVLITLVALLLQAIFLAHGGITTLGADVLSMGVAGGLVGYGTFHGCRRAGIGMWAAAFLAGMFSDWATYATTALVVALGLHGDKPALGLFLAVGAAFVPTQLPLGIVEGLLTAGALAFVERRRPDLLIRLGLARAVTT